MTIEPIGEMRTCFPEKFGIPRQPGLAPLARGILSFDASQPSAVWRDAMRGLDGFSHVWVTFQFDRAVEEGWKALVRPPRLGGKEKMGVWATRSPHRPNFLGQSLLAIESVDFETPSIRFCGVDLLDGTPILDLRPFHPDCDIPRSITRDGWIGKTAEPTAAVRWTDLAVRQIMTCRPSPPGMPEYEPTESHALVSSLVSLDPRPGHLRGGTGDWAMRILGFDVKFRMDDDQATVLSVV